MPDPLPVSDLPPKQENVVTLLHLSDLHFRASTRTVGEKEQFLNSLETCLTTCRQEGTAFDLVLVTGDLVDGAELGVDAWRAALDKTRAYLENLCLHVAVDPRQGLRVIPGNHDFRWKGNLYVTALKDAFEKTFADYRGHMLYTKLNLLLACFDSNATTYRFELAKGRVDMAEFDQLARRIGDLPSEHRTQAEKTALRLALVHHHPLPIAESEVLEPRSRWDWVFGRQLEGAPEYMLLRNSGTFLHRLLRDNFRLVLHGHLHKRGYWRPSTFSGGEDRWLEIIAAGSAGSPGPGDAHTFNVVRIRHPEQIDSVHYQFQSEGHILDPVPMSTAGYEQVRAQIWARFPVKPGLVKCDTFSKRWDIILPEGDLVTTEMFKGLRSASSQSVDHIELFTSSAQLTAAAFQAKCLSPGVNVTTRTDPKPGTPGQQRRFVHQVWFDPPLLDRPVDLICHRMTYGVVYSSPEAQRHGRDLPQTTGYEEAVQRIDWPCARMLLNLRFLGRPEWLPEEVVVNVRDVDNRPADLERLSSHVTWHYWGPKSEPLLQIEAPNIPEFLLSVHQPQPHHQYVLRWRLPTPHPQAQLDSLLNLREGLLKLDQKPAHHAAAHDLLQQIVRFVREELPARCPNDHATWNDRELYAYLFAFDDNRSELVCTVTTAPTSDPLLAPVAWGKDVIGTAFRRLQPVGFSRRHFQPGSHLYDKIPAGLEVLFAFPLDGTLPAGARSGKNPTFDGPVGVVALASYTRTSGLQFLKREKVLDEVFKRIAALWIGLRKLL